MAWCHSCRQQFRFTSELRRNSPVREQKDGKRLREIQGRCRNSGTKGQTAGPPTPENRCVSSRWRREWNCLLTFSRVTAGQRSMRSEPRGFESSPSPARSMTSPCNFVASQSPLLAQSGQTERSAVCPLSREKRTSFSKGVRPTLPISTTPHSASHIFSAPWPDAQRLEEIW